MDTPKQIENPNLSDLRERCQDYIDHLNSTNYSEDHLSDLESYIFEAALESVFGENVWAFVNKKIV